MRNERIETGLCGLDDQVSMLTLEADIEALANEPSAAGRGSLLDDCLWQLAGEMLGISE